MMAPGRVRLSVRDSAPIRLARAKRDANRRLTASLPVIVGNI